MTAHNAEGEGVTPLSDMITPQGRVWLHNIAPEDAAQFEAEAEAALSGLEDAQLVARIRFQEMRAERAENRAAEVEQELTTLRTAARLALAAPYALSMVANDIDAGVTDEDARTDYASGIAADNWIATAAAVRALRALLPATSTGDRPVPESE